MSHYEENRVACTPVAEGVRFEVGHASACAVRNEQRDISVRVRRRGYFLQELLGRVPLVRGIIRLFAAIGNLLGGIGEAERLKPQSVVRGSAFTRQFATLFRTTPQSLIGLLDGFAIPVILLALMIGLPMLVEQGLLALGDLPRFAVNTICLAFRIAGAVLSVYFICRLKLVSRLCMYRGASAKVLNAYEAYGPNLSHEDALLSSRLTDRSDGAFLIAVLLASLIGFACFRTDGLLMRLGYRAGVILTAAAMLNELILPLERARPETLGATLRTPLVGLQHLFTLEPHNQMIEVAVCAFRAAYENDIA